MTGPPSWRTKLAPVVLGAVLVQVLMFFFGLMVPLNRILLEWNRTVDERRSILAPNGQAIKTIADQLPMDARVYLLDPDATTHKNSFYYFYPRIVSITMTDACYEAIYEHWDERPTTDWLQAHGYTHLLSYKDRRLTQIQPPKPEQGNTDGR